MKQISEIIQYLRETIQTCHENVERLKKEDKDYNFSLGKGAMANTILLYIGAKPEIDQSLLIECNLLIPKGAYWAGHELNRMTHYYQEYAKQGDWKKFIQSEYSLRRALLKARLEVHGKIDKYNG